MFNRVMIKNVCLFASKVEKNNTYKIFRICFDSGVNFFYLTINDEFQFDFLNDIQVYHYIVFNGLSYENK